MNNEKLTAAELFSKLGESLKQDGRLQIDEAKLNLSEKIYSAMQEQRITEAELSRRIGSSRSYVNKVLQGDTNFTIESLVKIGLAIDCELSIDLAPPGSKVAEVEGQISYVHEEPIAAPTIISAGSIEGRNVLSFGDYKSSKTIKVETESRTIKERRHAAS